MNAREAADAAWAKKQHRNGHDQDAAEFGEPINLLDETAVPPFPPGFLPGVLGAYTAGQAFDLQVPLDFIGIPTLVAAATAIGKEFRMAPKAWAAWIERACLWGAIVGSIGDGKSPAFQAALAPVWALERKIREAFEEEFETYRRKAKLAKVIDKQWQKAATAAIAKGREPPPEPEGAGPPPKPVQQQLVAIDTTQERVAAAMQDNPRGLMLFRDELSGWFRSFNQYRPGPDEQFYLKCHAGGPWFQQRKVGDIAIPDAYLNILGGFQPDVVAEALARRFGKADNGMTARFGLIVWPAQMDRQWVDNSPDREASARIARLFAYLRNRTPEGFVGPKPEGSNHYPPFRFTPEGQKVFREWYDHHHKAQRALEPDAAIKGHFAKYDGLFASLALVHHLIRHALGEREVLSAPAQVDEHTAGAVRDFIDGYLRPHARKIYRHLGRDPGHDGACRIAKWILDNPQIDGFTAREITRKGWAGLTGKDENTGKNYLAAALRYLDAVAGWIREEEVPTGPRGGRPTIFYRINPRQFAGQ
jgi:hypothetical protein